MPLAIVLADELVLSVRVSEMQAIAAGVQVPTSAEEVHGRSTVGESDVPRGCCDQHLPVQPESSEVLSEGGCKRQRKGLSSVVSRHPHLQEQQQSFYVGAKLRSKFGDDGVKPTKQDFEKENVATYRLLTICVVSDPDGSQFPGVGGRMWAASATLAQLLLRPATLGTAWAERLSSESAPSLRTLELGAGTAAPSLCLAHLGHRAVVTDLPEVTALTRLNVDANALADVDVRPLAWGDEEAAREVGDVDLVIGADLFYDPALFGPLLDTLRALSSFRWALLAVVLRPEDLGEETFENFCEDEGLKLELRHTELPRGCGTHRVNVYELDGATTRRDAPPPELGKAGV